VIPALNEAPTVAEVVRGVRDVGIDALVVDDGSTDGTATIAARAGARVVSHERNLGKGAALATGFREGLGLGYDAVMVVDADGQHPPAAVPRFIACADETGADLVVGTRMRRRRGMPFVRWATNAMMSILLSMLAGVRLTDTQCGMKLLGARTLELLLGPARTEAVRVGGAPGGAARFDVESEIILRAAAHGLRIAEVPIPTIYIPGRRSRIRPLPDTVRFLALVARHFLHLA